MYHRLITVSVPSASLLATQILFLRLRLFNGLQFRDCQSVVQQKVPAEPAWQASDVEGYSKDTASTMPYRRGQQTTIRHFLNLRK